MGPWVKSLIPCMIESILYCRLKKWDAKIGITIKVYIPLPNIYKLIFMITTRKATIGFHLLAAITVLIWGTTFVSTKVLINNGLSPTDILFYRFLIAYIGIWFISPRILFANNWKDEGVFVLLGLTGGSIYFIAENTALSFTLASNVALIICTTPILSAIVSYFFYKKEPFRPRFIFGSIIALFGVALIVFNGSFILQLNPLGDILTLIAALMWAFYCLFLKQMNAKYSTLFITRKVFFYGLITLLPFFFIYPLNVDVKLLSQPIILSNLLFLGVLASMLCYISWTIVVNKLGIICAANYIYVIPLVTLITSAIVIDEQITLIASIGALLVLMGVYFAENKN